jgi:tRNA (cmo5U34)-methyltransferase
MQKKDVPFLQMSLQSLEIMYYLQDTNLKYLELYPSWKKAYWMTIEKPRGDEWLNIEHTAAYLARADKLPHRKEGEQVLESLVPKDAKRILDLGAGDGRTIALAMQKASEAQCVAVDFSEPMLRKIRKRFANDNRVKILKLDLNKLLPALELGEFDVVVSSLAIHHLPDDRKKELYQEIFDLLGSGGVFCNLEHVSSPSNRIHLKFLNEIGMTPESEDPSNRLLDVETQLHWLRQIGFVDVDCYWKWLEVALLAGYKPNLRR